nr:Gag-Pol polyprotein [Tanacetum cinerariifolium]
RNNGAREKINIVLAASTNVRFRHSTTPSCCGVRTEDIWRLKKNRDPFQKLYNHFCLPVGDHLSRNLGLLKFKYHKEHPCPSCKQGKSKRASHLPKPVPNSRQRLHLLHMDLCGPMRIASINGKRTMLIFSRAPLFLWAEAIATACFTQNRSIIHRRFNKTPYELINGRKPDILFLHVFGALCYPKNDREDIRKLSAKSDIGFFIGYSADSCAFRIYNRRTKKIIETMNVSFDELSAMAFEQHSSKPGLQCMTSRQISSGLDLTYAPSTNVPIPTNSSSHATNIPITSQDVDELNQNAMVNGNTFVNPFAISFTSAAQVSSSQQNVDPSNMHTNQLRFDGDICMYALSVSTMEPKNVKEAMTDPVWIDSMQEELLQFKRLDVWVLVPAPDNSLR